MDRASIAAAYEPSQPQVDAVAQALLLALDEAQAWPAQILSLALAALGDIHLPEPQGAARRPELLSVLPALYWVHGLDQAGVWRAADTVAGLWASGAVQVALPDQGQGLQHWWRTRRERLSAEERAHLLEGVFDARDFEPAMRRLCRALAALADNAGQHDLREEVGLQLAGANLLELCGVRLEGAALPAAAELLAQMRAAVQLLSARALQSAFAVRDFYTLIELGERGRSPPGRARRLAERTQAGAAVLRWLAQSAAQRFAVEPKADALQAVMSQAQRWLMTEATGEPAHDDSGAGQRA
jgi:hypothetical protein